MLAMCWCAQATATAALPEPLAHALKRHGLTTRGLSVYVHEAGAPAPLLALAADEPRQPASVIKILTTLAALEELGPAYRWKTEIWATGPVRDGILDGDLHIKGYGDPYLVIEHFWRLLRALRQAGVTAIEGDLVLDQTYFAPGAEDPGDFDGQANRVYNVLPAALLVNFQAVNFRFVPDTTANRLHIHAEPWPAQLSLENNLRLTRGGCRGGWLDKVGMRSTEMAGRPTMRFNGDYDAGCGERELFRVVAEPLPYIHGVFQSVWREMGGRFGGGVREAPLPADARLLASISSPPLADIVRSVNKFSNNVMTRQLLLTLGAHQDAPPGTVEKGIAAIQAWMRKRELDFPELVLENGTGLSRQETISARHLGELLLLGYASPVMPEFISSLPISGLDGTMRHRFGATPVAGRVHLKTGSINSVQAVAGYVLDRRNRRIAVVVLHNHPRAGTAAAVEFQNAIVEWVYQRP
jgi:D-alanyl-D-alanine carboxypeptidase/D-alanyl-D-alanine-endopeptidase (penicillin-binding protein 4)